MLQTLSGECFELPPKLPRTVVAVREWWWKEMNRDTVDKIWRCQVSVSDVTEMKRAEEEEEEKKSKSEGTAGKAGKALKKERYFFGMVGRKSITVKDHDLYEDHQHWKHSMYYFEPDTSGVNEAVIDFFCSLPLKDFPRFFLRLPHPSIVEKILNEANDSELITSVIFWLAGNPDPRVMSLVEWMAKDMNNERSKKNVFVGLHYNPSPTLVPYFLARPFAHVQNHQMKLFATTDPDLIRHVWEGMKADCNLFRFLPVNNEPAAIELILRDFDRFRLHRFRVAYACSHEEVLRRCLACLPTSNVLIDYEPLLENPSDVVADWILSQSYGEKCLDSSALNTNDRVVEYQLAHPPKRRNDRFWRLIRNPHPRVVDWVCGKLERFPLVSLREIIQHERDVMGSGVAPLPPRVMAELIQRHDMGKVIPICMAVRSFLKETDIDIHFD